MKQKRRAQSSILLQGIKPCCLRQGGKQGDSRQQVTAVIFIIDMQKGFFYKNDLNALDKREN
ncbi:MAG TPA: hypothetical protein PK926_11540 [Spirochaetota bacterium]|nr:hypothetical protein [Spirochaetota bacterium]HPI89133.1 hypothetical protein [Spirochaetota bacterium]HPR48887.1 hypothetical protein [Spirochaetota bacterium]